MRRRLVLVLLSFAMLWQAFAFAGQASVFADAAGGDHALLHWHEEAHHHHDDGSVTVDDSAESVQHVIADSCLNAPALWMGCEFLLGVAQPVLPAVQPGIAFPSPDIDGLRRPPRLIA